MPKPLDRRLRNRESDARRKAEKPWRGWYNTPRWQAIRSAQLSTSPLCERCEANGIVMPATVCHHTIKHNGDPVLFWNGPFSSSCAPCHDIDEQRVERGGKARQDVGEDGWPKG